MSVAHTMPMHTYLVVTIRQKWRIIGKTWSARAAHKGRLNALVDEVMGMNPRCLAEPYVGHLGVRRYHADLLDDVAAGWRILHQLETNLWRMLRRLYVMLNLAVPVDVTGYRIL